MHLRQDTNTVVFTENNFILPYSTISMFICTRMYKITMRGLPGNMMYMTAYLLLTVISVQSLHVQIHLLMYMLCSTLYTYHLYYYLHNGLQAITIFGV